MIKYQGIYSEMKTRILSGEYSSEEKLPDGRSLAAEFECSEITIKKSHGLPSERRAGST